MILELIAEARASGARLGPCCDVLELDVRTVQRWLLQGPDGGEDRRHGPNTTPANKLSDDERQQIVELATSPEFVDLAELHRMFGERRVNLINYRKEFFSVTLEEIESAVHRLHGRFEFTKLAEAAEYRTSLATRKRVDEQSSGTASPRQTGHASAFA